jgi:hypothetical protein
LLDPFEEEFNLPPFFIEQSYLRGFYLKVVRQVYKGSPMLMTIKAYTTKLSRIFLFSQWTGESDYLIKKNIVRSVKKFISLDDLVLKLSSLPNNKIRFNDIDVIQFGKIKVASIKDIVSVWLIRDFIHSLRIMNSGFCNMNECRYLSSNIKKRVHFDSRLCRSKLCPPEKTQAQINGSGVVSSPKFSNV